LLARAYEAAARNGDIIENTVCYTRLLWTKATLGRSSSNFDFCRQVEDFCKQRECKRTRSGSRGTDVLWQYMAKDILNRVGAAADLVLRDPSVSYEVRAKRAEALLFLSQAFSCATSNPGKEDEEGAEAILASADAALEEMFLQAGEGRRAG
jgi:hypothetical protein